MDKILGIGKRIAKFRELKEVDLEELSKRTGLSEDILRDIEEDRVYPAIGILLRISRALGTRLGTFIDDKISEDPIVIHNDSRPHEKSAYRGGKGELPLKFYSLGRGKTDRHMEPFYIEIYPSSKDIDFSSHEGEEFIVVVSGKIEVTYGNKKIYIKARGLNLLQLSCTTQSGVCRC